MKKWGFVLAALAVALAVGLFLSTKKSTPPAASPDATAAADSAVANALARQNPATVAIIQSNFARVHAAAESQTAASAMASLPPPGQAAPLEFTNFAPRTAVENMRRAIRQYGDMFGGNPVGTNPEITSQLGGDNPKHINFLDPEAGERVNANGELVDAWGTPYFFHQISSTEMEIHSAGPDKVMWTLDDVVVK